MDAFEHMADFAIHVFKHIYLANKIDVFMQLALYSAKIHLMHTEISIYANPLRHNMSLYLCICLYIFEQVCDVFVFLI